MSEFDAIRDELRPKDLHFRKECDDYKCGAHKSWNEGFDSAVKLCREELDKLRAENQRYRTALQEMWYQAKRSYGTEEKILSSEPFPWGLVKEALAIGEGEGQ